MKSRKKTGEVSKVSNKQKTLGKNEHRERNLDPHKRIHKKKSENLQKDIEDYIKKFQEDVKKIRKRIYTHGQK